jgi:hypothetical protein
MAGYVTKGRMITYSMLKALGLIPSTAEKKRKIIMLIFLFFLTNV